MLRIAGRVTVGATRTARTSEVKPQYKFLHSPLASFILIAACSWGGAIWDSNTPPRARPVPMTPIVTVASACRIALLDASRGSVAAGRIPVSPAGLRRWRWTSQGTYKFDQIGKFGTTEMVDQAIRHQRLLAGSTDFNFFRCQADDASLPVDQLK